MCLADDNKHFESFWFKDLKQRTLSWFQNTRTICTYNFSVPTIDMVAGDQNPVNCIPFFSLL